MNNDIIGLILSYAYATALLILSEILVRKFGWMQFVTRKLVHIGAGMWVWGIIYFFDNWYLGIIPFATFIIFNFILYKYHILQGVDEKDSSPGTVYFAFAITVLFGLFWRTGIATDRVHLAVAAVMAMTWGDGLASLIGKMWGQHKYTFFKHTRTLEGSAAMLIAAFISIWFTLSYLPGSGLSPLSVPSEPGIILGVSALSAIVGSLAEAVSPAGTDNLTVPFSVVFVLWMFL